MIPSLALPLAALLSPLLAASAPVLPRTEVSVVLGGTFLAADRDLDVVPPPVFLDVLGPLLPQLPFTATAETRLGGSVLQGLQVAHRFGERAWLEWAFAVAPAHELRRRFNIRCQSDLCPLVPLPVGLGLLPSFEDEEDVLSYRWSLGGAYDLGGGRTRPFISAGVGAVSYDAGSWETDLAIRLGGGVRHYFGRVSVRLEVADHWIPEHFLTDESEHDVVVQAGLGYRIR